MQFYLDVSFVRTLKNEIFDENRRKKSDYVSFGVLVYQTD